MEDAAAFAPRSKPGEENAPLMRSLQRPADGPRREQTFCYACGAQLDSRAVLCPTCGVSQRKEAISSAHPNAVVALILNIFFPGVGTLVLGQTTPGIIQLVLWIVSIPLMFILIGFPLYLAVWIWALVLSIQSFSNSR